MHVYWKTSTVLINQSRYFFKKMRITCVSCNRFTLLGTLERLSAELNVTEVVDLPAALKAELVPCRTLMRTGTVQERMEVNTFIQRAREKERSDCLRGQPFWFAVERAAILDCSRTVRFKSSSP